MTLQLINAATDKPIVNQVKLALLGIMQSWTFDDLANMQNYMTNDYLEVKLFNGLDISDENKAEIKVMMLDFTDKIHAKVVESGNNVDINLNAYKNRYICAEAIDKSLGFFLNEAAKDLCDKITITGSEFSSKSSVKFVEIKTCGKLYVGTFINNELSVADSDHKECYGYYTPIPPFCHTNLTGRKNVNAQTDFMMDQLRCLAIHEATKATDAEQKPMLLEA